MGCGVSKRFKSDVGDKPVPLLKAMLVSSKVLSMEDLERIYDRSASWELGEGGCGSVVSVARRSTGEICAMKTIKLRKRDTMDDVLNEFVIQRTLDHPNIA